MTDVLVGLDIGDEHLTLAHSISAILGHIDRRLDRSTKLQLVGLDRDDTNEWHFDNQLLRVLIVKAVLLDGPASTFKVQALDVRASIKFLGNLIGVALLGHLSVEQTLIERPAAGTARRLQQGSQVGLGDAQTREPDDLGLVNLNPLPVLVVAALEVLDPVDEGLQALRGEPEPHGWNEAIEDAVTQLFELLGHTDLTDKSTLQVKE